MAVTRNIGLDSGDYLDTSFWAESLRSSMMTPLYVKRYCGRRIGNKPDSHGHWEITAVFRGQGQHVESDRTIALREGTAILIPPGQAHHEHSRDSEFDTLWIGLQGDCFDGLPRNITFTAQEPELRPLCELLWLRTRLAGWAVSGLEIDGLTRAIVGRLLHLFTSENATPAKEERLSRIVTYLHVHYKDDLTVAHLAAQCDLSEGHFLKWFRANMGQRPTEYIARLRIQNAQEMLKQSSLTIKTVARAVGYDDPLYFTRVFTNIVGISPREWRNRI